MSEANDLVDQETVRAPKHNRGGNKIHPARGARTLGGSTGGSSKLPNMPYNTMNILSWNTRGFGTNSRRRIIKKFMRKHHKDDIIALQKLKVTDQRKLETNLRALMPKGRVIVDYTHSGWGGCALLISSKLRVSEVGTSEFGGAVWATVHAAHGSVMVASLHAPNTKEECQLYWEWWDRQVDGEDWILAGDFNNVELPDDNKGKSALIRGAEERTWRCLMDRTDMVDAYLTAANTLGGLYSRLAFCRERFDRARLDRFYLSNRDEWCELIKQVEHHSGVIQSLEEIREEHPLFCHSSQKRWELAWGRIKHALKEEKEKERAEGREGEDTRREVEELRIRAETEDLSTKAMDILRRKETELRERDLRDAKSWKYRSQEK
ncbi:hypothetical protein R1sor_009036 [Riccia sorocarpa]|uniref:Endonuclease/exonuclease/phosphatase domain-containing protein n=1 Tax=Riccia sorocarpa TaxID=122646 RepID=A0ABD3H4M7_9MARC